MASGLLGEQSFARSPASRVRLVMIMRTPSPSGLVRGYRDCLHHPRQIGGRQGCPRRACDRKHEPRRGHRSGALSRVWLTHREGDSPVPGGEFAAWAGSHVGGEDPRMPPNSVAVAISTAWRALPEEQLAYFGISTAAGQGAAAWAPVSQRENIQGRELQGRLR